MCTRHDHAIRAQVPEVIGEGAPLCLLFSWLQSSPWWVACSIWSVLFQSGAVNIAFLCVTVVCLHMCAGAGTEGLEALRARLHQGFQPLLPACWCARFLNTLHSSRGPLVLLCHHLHLPSEKFTVAWYRPVRSVLVVLREGPQCCCWCHAGGRGVIEGLGGQLGLNRQQVEPSFNSLYWYALLPAHGLFLPGCCHCTCPRESCCSKLP